VAQFGGDVDALCDHLRKLEAEYADRIVDPRNMPKYRTDELRAEHAREDTLRYPAESAEGEDTVRASSGDSESGDPLIDEIRKLREAISNEYGNDQDRLMAHLREIEAKYADRVVSRMPKPRDPDAAPPEK
jgi:hypothetical protein